ncbi:MAG: PAS domain S-box protein [Chloroflexi bacterium]|nr:PAS domain S-box protein [Chloroflexota bacterium]
MADTAKRAQNPSAKTPAHRKTLKRATTAARANKSHSSSNDQPHPQEKPNQRFRQVFEQHAAMMLLVDPDTGAIVDANPAAVNFYGYSRQALCNLTMNDIHTLPPDQVASELQKAKNKQRDYFILPHRLANGEVRTVEIRSSPIEVKQHPLLLAIVQDITDRKEAEEALSKSKSFYLKMLDKFPIPVWRSNVNGGCDFFNRAWLEFTGRTREQESGNGWLEGVHPEDLGYTLNTYLDAFNSRQPFEMEYRILHRDETYHHLLDFGSPFTDVDGNFAGYVGSCIDITERKRIEQERQLLTALVENSPDLSGIASLDGQVLYLNPAARKLLMLGSEEFKTKALFDFFLREDEEHVRAEILPMVLQTGQWSGEYRLREPLSGQAIPVDLNTFIIRDPERSKPIAIAFVAHDLSRRKRSEQVLRDSEARFRSLMQTASDAIVSSNKQGKIVVWNHSAETLFGYRVDEVLGKSVDLLMPSHLRNVHKEKIATTMVEGSEILQQRIESVGLKKDGTEFPIEISVSAWKTGADTFFTTIMRDITSRKRAEYALRQAHADLEHRVQERTAELAQANAALQADIAERTRAEQAEHEQRRLAEALRDTAAVLNGTLSFDQVLERILSNVERVVPHDMANIMLVEAGKLRVVRSRGYVEQGWEIPVETLRWSVADTPTFKHMFETCQPLLIPDTPTSKLWTTPPELEKKIRSYVGVPIRVKGECIGLLNLAGLTPHLFTPNQVEPLQAFANQAAIAIENAQLYQSAQDKMRQLQESQAKLVQSEKMGAIGRLTASIAHEINNPLQTVKGCLTLVQEQLEEVYDRDELKHDLEMAAAETERIAVIVGRLREFFRPSRSGLFSTDVNAIVTNVLELTAKQLQHNAVTVAANLASNLPTVEANPDQLKQVFLNLILNALDAMPQGGKLKIETTSSTLPAYQDRAAVPAVQIDFRDSGEGIPANILPHVFEPFFTTKEKGTGLGLAISYEIISSFGGEITVASEGKTGTTFTLQLPVRESK